MTLVVEPQRPRRSPDRTARLLLVVGLGVVGVAVAKPWGEAPATARDRAVSTPPAVSAPARPPAPPTLPPGTVDLPRWAAVAGAISPHEAWGIRAIVDSPLPPNGSAVEGRGAGVLVELWAPTEGTVTGPPGAEADRATPATTPAAGNVVPTIRSTAPIRLLGLTAPEGLRPDSVRIWRVDADGRATPVRFVRLAWFRRQPPLLVPAAPAGGFALWTRATYRISAEFDGVRRIWDFRLDALPMRAPGTPP